jgi:hypothetical protein
VNLHGPGGAGGHTKAAHAAFLLIEANGHLWPIDKQSPRGTDRRAGTTVSALCPVSVDLLANGLHLHTMVLQVLNPPVKVPSRSRQLHDHDPFLAGQYGRLQDIERQVEITGKETDDWLFHRCLFELKHKHSRIHGYTSDDFGQRHRGPSSESLKTELTSFVNRQAGVCFPLLQKWMADVLGRRWNRSGTDRALTGQDN